MHYQFKTAFFCGLYKKILPFFILSFLIFYNIAQCSDEGVGAGEVRSIIGGSLSITTEAKKYNELIDKYKNKINDIIQKNKKVLVNINRQISDVEKNIKLYEKSLAKLKTDMNFYKSNKGLNNYLRSGFVKTYKELNYQKEYLKTLQNSKNINSNIFNNAGKWQTKVVALKSLDFAGKAINVYDLSKELVDLGKDIENGEVEYIKSVQPVMEKIVAFNPIAGGTLTIKDNINKTLDLSYDIGAEYYKSLTTIQDTYFKQYRTLAQRGLDGKSYDDFSKLFKEHRDEMRKSLDRLHKEINDTNANISNLWIPTGAIPFHNKDAINNAIINFKYDVLGNETEIQKKQRNIYDKFVQQRKDKEELEALKESLKVKVDLPEKNDIINQLSIINNLFQKKATTNYDYDNQVCIGDFDIDNKQSETSIFNNTNTVNTSDIDGNDDIFDYINNKFVNIANEFKMYIETILLKNKVDVFFLADNTSSMGDLVNNAKNQAKNILDSFKEDERFEDIQVQFGVGSYYGDPSEENVSPLSSYKLLQSVTSDNQKIIDAINKWEAEGGGDIEEGNFFAVHQVATEGKETPRNNAIATYQKTGWRDDTSKIIIVFGDAPSWQNTINENELKQILKTEQVVVSFIDTSDLNVGLKTDCSNDSSGRQMDDAAKEIADFTGGTYSKLIDTAEVKKSILDTVYDSITKNTYTGGHISIINSENYWRKRTPSSVTATINNDEELNFVLKYPGMTDAHFSANITEGVETNNNYYRTSIYDANDIFGVDMSEFSVLWYNESKDFFRFVLKDNNDNSIINKSRVEGYYGYRLDQSNIPQDGVFSYSLRQRLISPFDSNATYYSDNMKLFVNWKNKSFLGYELNASLDDIYNCTSLLIGKLDDQNIELNGNYFGIFFDSNKPISFSINDTNRSNSRLQLYGKNLPNGIGGTFGISFTEKDNYSLSSILISGFMDKKITPLYEPEEEEVWNGYATGVILDNNNISLLKNKEPNSIAITYYPSDGQISSTILVSGDESDIKFETNSSSTNTFVSTKSFGAHNNESAYILSTIDEDYQYLSWGKWYYNDDVNGITVTPSPWIAGLLTPISEIPKEGEATYNGIVKGQLHENTTFNNISGNCTLSANFTDNSLSGTFNNIIKDNGVLWLDNIVVNASWNSNSNKISGQLSHESISSGSLNASFFGPNAHEVGGSWSIDNKDCTATGIFAGKKEN